MKKHNQDLRGKLLLLVSAVSCLIMITTARSFALPLWLVGIAALCGFILPGCGITVSRAAAPMKGMRYLLSAAAVSITLGYVFFYGTWSYSDSLRTLSALTHLPARLLALGAAGGLIVLSIPALAFLLERLCRDGRARWKQLDAQSGDGICALGAFGILAGIYLLGILALIRANFYYIDDLGRAAHGYKEWNFFSRFLSVALSTYLHGGNYLTDVSPLPQLLTVLIMAVSGIVMLAVVYERTRFSLWEILAMVPLGLSPYFLECFSYKYDAPYMGLSVLGAVLPLLLCKSSRRVYAAACIIGTLTVCTTYQAASGIFPMLVVLIALRMWNRGGSLKDAVLFCLRSAAAYGVGLILFMGYILRPERTYAGNMAAPQSLPQTLVNNYRAYWHLVATDLKVFWLLLIALLAAGFLIRSVLGSSRTKVPAAALSCAALIVMVLLCFGMYPALADPAFDPRAMYGFGALTAILAMTAAEGKGHLPMKLAAAVLSWIMLVFAFTYGNALSVQAEYMDYRIQMVIEDLNDLEVFQTSPEPVPVEIYGSAGYSPILRNMPQNYGILNRLVPVMFRGVWMWGEYGLHNYYDLRNVAWIEGSETDPDTLELIGDHMLHTIRGNDTLIQVELKQAEESK